MAKKTPNPVDVHVGSRLRERRQRASMSQTVLANAIGVTFQQVQKYEKGTNRMGSSRLQQIADVFKVPVTYFFEGAPGQSKPDHKSSSPNYVAEYLATDDGKALTRAYMKIKSAKMRRAIVNMVAQLAD